MKQEPLFSLANITKSTGLFSVFECSTIKEKHQSTLLVPQYLLFEELFLSGGRQQQQPLHVQLHAVDTEVSHTRCVAEQLVHRLLL